MCHSSTHPAILFRQLFAHTQRLMPLALPFVHLEQQLQRQLLVLGVPTYQLLQQVLGTPEQACHKVILCQFQLGLRTIGVREHRPSQ